MSEDEAGGPGGGFLARWARRKSGLRHGSVGDSPTIGDGRAVEVEARAGRSDSESEVAVEGAADAEAVCAASPMPPVALPPPRPAPPTLDDVAMLTRTSDYSRFVGAGVDRAVSNAAMKKLFTDPRFNVMDGLDTYIDDYNKPDPLPVSVLRRMNHSKALGLFADDPPPVPDGRDSGMPDATVFPSHRDPVEPSLALDSSPGDVRPAFPTLSEPSAARPDDHADLRLQPDDAAGRPGVAPGPRA